MADHVRPQVSGIAGRHRDGIEEIMVTRNCFLFVRPTEYDSTILIEEGFATKSMDIHDKSSNWGPMAGMVPCDPAFNKKTPQDPSVAPAYHAHGKAKPIKLELPWSLYQRFRGDANRLDRVRNRYLLLSNGKVVPRSSNPTLGIHDIALQRQRRFVTNRPVGHVGPKSTLFCLRGNTGGSQEVFWVSWNPMKTEGKLIPIWVWAYTIEGRTKPVTGDYDLWMVAPHTSAWQSHAESKALEDDHGKSTASPYTVALMDEMNAACKKNAPSTNRVFNHGAESQNYGFTQALDTRLVMFTPTGESRMVDMADMPGILGDLTAMNYLAIHNKRYEELDPRIMNTSTIQAVAQFERETKENAELIKADKAPKPRTTDGLIAGIGWKSVTRQRFRKALTDLKRERASGSSGADLARAHWGLVRAAVHHGFEPARMVRFHDDLKAILALAKGSPTTLAKGDFPDSLTHFSQKAYVVQRSLQIAAVEATVGSGETDPERFSDTFRAWADHNTGNLDELFNAFEEVAGRT